MPHTSHRNRRPVAAALEPVDTVFDRIVNRLAEHPRATCALICAVALIPLMLDAPK